LLNRKVTAMYFSATGTTEKVVSSIAKNISAKINGDTQISVVDCTLPHGRQKAISFTEEEIVVIGVPVYAGRVPNVLLQYLNLITSEGALAIAVVVYGNRNYDDALIELSDILNSRGFKVVAGGAFIGEHSFSNTLAQDRPDDKDMAIANEFANQVAVKIVNEDTYELVEVKGNRPYRKYYIPKNGNNEPVDIRKVTPKTSPDCINCKLCVAICPMGSIDNDDVSTVKGICIKCGACIKKCPTHSKYYDDVNYLRHKHELEVDCVFRREPELFV